MCDYLLAVCPGIIYLACFGMSCYIPVAMQRPLPGWVISMFVAYGLDLAGVLLIMCCGADAFLTLFGGIAWIGWFDALIPYTPINGVDPEHTAYIKCVFSGFQLANGAGHLLAVGVVLLGLCGAGAFGSCLSCIGIAADVNWSRFWRRRPAPKKSYWVGIRTRGDECIAVGDTETITVGDTQECGRRYA
ncbi:hypothetical protein CALVIDRAFT_556878 [Calocera viscosa TUFC12733]|uniref:Uncharacterized protein n=1 Tax=Calocera viscosa (strain TUFC12733) TaxID=1330018 RepID=A0A167JJV1_CALVF|nr:hypothetical protein CALVIDRAFT_556878 [Calocera viscosa TUFC12733]